MTSLKPELAVVIIDGRSGSGKTTLAAECADRLSTRGHLAQTLHLDSLYPGWGGLAEGSAAVAGVLAQRWYQPYDWATGEFSPSRIAVDPNRPLVIEGCGSLTASNLTAARKWVGESGGVHAIWIECAEALRRARALTRDGEMFAPHWDRWAAQEQAQFMRHKPWLLADEIAHSE